MFEQVNLGGERHFYDWIRGASYLNGAGMERELRSTLRVKAAPKVDPGGRFRHTPLRQVRDPFSTAARCCTKQSLPTQKDRNQRSIEGAGCTI